MLELSAHARPRVSITAGLPPSPDHWPLPGKFSIEIDPSLFHKGVGEDGARRALCLAHATIDARIGIDDEHVAAFTKGVHRANIDTVLIFAPDTLIGDGVRHVYCDLDEFCDLGERLFDGCVDGDGRIRSGISGNQE